MGKANWATQVHTNHWYFTRIVECPLCGKQRVSRERRYGDKPTNESDTTKKIFIEDGCKTRQERVNEKI